MGPEALAQVLRPLLALFPAKSHPELLSGLESGDDAAVYKLDDSRALVFTTDFFTPIVDDPFDFGAIAAANALSDVYSMGGEAVLALNLAGFPSTLPEEVLAEILRGGAHTAKEAGCVVGGGHTVTSQEPFYGLAVVGLVHPDRLFVKNGVRPGDALLLTKPLGTGVITTAAKGGIAADGALAAAIESMKTLNRAAAQVVAAHEVRACTDVTGFSLLGHALDIARRSSVGLHIRLSPDAMIAGALQAAERNAFPGATGRNRVAYEASVRFNRKLDEAVVKLLFSPETSGGLLAAVPPGRMSQCIEALRSAGVPVVPIGETDDAVKPGTLLVDFEA